MEIRPITADDYEAHRHIVSLAFARGKTPEFTPDIYEQADRTRIGVYEGGRLQAALGIVDFEFLFGADRRPCGGIFGVAAEPAMRGRGFAGALLQRSLELMRERGQFLSSLWPFDLRYYRSFGWEWTGETCGYTIPLELIPASSEAELVEAVHDRIPDRIGPIYLRCAARYNGMLARSPKRWEQITGPANGRRRAAYVYRRDRMDEGYALFRFGDKEDELNADELMALTRRAYEGLLGVARRHAMTAKKLIHSAPVDDMLPSVLRHWDVETKVDPAGMGRVVDVRAALMALQPAADMRSVAVIGVTDVRCPWNDGAWRIEVEGGRVTAERSDREPGISLDIQALTQAYWGSPSLLRLRQWERIEVRDEAQFAAMASLLPPATAWLHDGF